MAKMLSAKLAAIYPIWIKHVFYQVVQLEQEKNPSHLDLYLYQFRYFSETPNDYQVAFFDFIKYLFNTREIPSDAILDDYLSIISTITYSDRYFGQNNGGKKIDLTVKELADLIAKFCSDFHLYWDDSKYTDYEFSYFTEKTIFGKALRDFDCFTTRLLADYPIATPTASSSTRHARSQSSSGTRTNYKDKGGQSERARGLVGNPHEKEYASSNQVYKIVDTINKSKRNKEIRAIVRPISPNGGSNSGISTNRVFISDANNWGDCVCTFFNKDLAQKFKDECEKVNTNISLAVVPMKADSNGYFTVNSDFGEVKVRAQSLNEDINSTETETMQEQTTTETMINPCPPVNEDFYKLDTHKSYE